MGQKTGQVAMHLSETRDQVLAPGFYPRGLTLHNAILVHGEDVNILENDDPAECGARQHRGRKKDQEGRSHHNST